MLFDSVAARHAPRVQAKLRVVSGHLFMLHGTAKLFHVPRWWKR